MPIINYKTQQAEMIYLSLLHTLRSYNSPYDEKFDQLSDELLERHEAVHLHDLLDGLYNFIVAENGFNFDCEE